MIMIRVIILSRFLTGCANTRETCLTIDMTASMNVAIFPTVGFGKVQPKVCFKSDEEIEDDQEGRQPAV